jgi:molybdenum cofactor biosynthesis enzyme MoaA
MNIKLYDTVINIKDHYCQLFNYPISKIDKPYINLSIRFNGCNANCDFCTYMNSASNFFNIDKYKNILNYIVNEKKIPINNFNFTGGEPTLKYDLFKETIDITTKIIKKNSNITIHTNGLNLDKLMSDKTIYNNINHISLSRHHYNDDINDQIFKTKTINNKDIKKLQEKIKNKNILNLSCNLIKGYIDNDNDIIKYMDKSIDIGIKSIGFITLMNNNKYSIENYIPFNFKNNKYFTMTKEWKNKNICKCNNYLYISNKYEKVLKVYNKHLLNSSIFTNNLTFDGENLMIGFNGDIIK